MKIAILAVGTNIHAERWVNAMAQRGLEVLLLTQQAPAPGHYHADVRMIVLPFKGMAGYALNAPFVWDICRRKRIAFLHVHYAGGYGTTALLTGTIPFITSVWGGDVYDVPERSQVHRWLIRAVLRRSLLITSTSETMAEKVRSFGLATPVSVVPFGIDTELFHPAAPHAEAKPSQLVIGTIKTLEPKYGIDTLLHGFALACHDPGFAAQDPLLRIVGPGSHRKAYERLAERLGLAHRVQFCGAIAHSEVPAMLRSLDIFVAASRKDSESFGVAVIEASACALPVVVSDAGGLPEVVEHDVTGIVMPRDRADVLAQALVRLAADPALRKALGDQGRAAVRSRYEWRDCVDQMIVRYQQVAAQLEMKHGDALSPRRIPISRIT